MTTAYALGQAAALEKFAARRGMREIINSMSSGNLSRANVLARTPGVLKPGTMGSQIRDLGAGGEGLATLVAHPQHGVSVRKMFNPNGGLYSRHLVNRKAQALPNLPGVAQTLGTAQTRHMTPVHFNEFVPGTQIKPSMLKNDPQLASQYRNSLLTAQRAARQKGYKLMDTRAGNAMVQPDGQVKFIDHVPVRANEVLPNAQARTVRKLEGDHVIPAVESTVFSPRPHSGFNPRAQTSAHDKGVNDAFKRYMFTGQLPTRAASKAAPASVSQPSVPPVTPSELAAYGADMGGFEPSYMPATAPQRRRVA